MQGGAIESVLIKPLKSYLMREGASTTCLDATMTTSKNLEKSTFCGLLRIIKRWHVHKGMTLNYSVIQRMRKLALCDDRKNSSTRGNLMEVFIGVKNYCLIKTPPEIWNGFKGVGVKPQLLQIVPQPLMIPMSLKELVHLPIKCLTTGV
jgi:dTDP-4-dehydrorhamnose 3,5-epimerase